MTTETDETCKTCKFFKAGGPSGLCRRRAPVDSTLSHRGIFPLVESSEWCGEYEKKKMTDPLCKCGHFLASHNSLRRCFTCGCAGFEVQS